MWRLINFNYCHIYKLKIPKLLYYQYQEHMKYTMKEPKRTSCEYQDISAIQFSAFSQDQIQNYSAIEIDDPQFYENDKPVKRGLFDARLGVSGPNQKCQTCGETIQCPGHFGHIRLTDPILHYGFLDTIVKVLRCICHHCFRLKRGSNKEVRQKMKDIKRIIDHQRRFILLEKLLSDTKKCTFAQKQEQDLFDKNYKPCGSTNPHNIILKNNKIYYIDSSKKSNLFDRRQIIRLLQGFSQYQSQCSFLGFIVTKPIDLVISNLLIPPPQIRPYVLINGQTKCQDDISFAYRKILKLNVELKKPGLSSTERYQKIDQIQNTVGSIMIKLKERKEIKRQMKINKKIKSISERLSGKQGRFRQNLLGKRVDFAARTVITPDPNLQINQVGIPQKIAKNLTIPQKVTITNYQQIIELCLQKKVKHLIKPPQQNLRNQQIAINVSKLQVKSKEQMKLYVSIGMIAQRVLQNGDYALLNRQPTLHRMSMMAHKIRILPYNTFRINPCVCMPYNADFDGDQMNIHIPQSYESLSELKNISIVENQIVGPKNGTTSLGFSQDSLLGVCLITSRDTFLCKQDIMNLLAKISDGQIYQLPIPAILKPEPLWTGKQIISLIIPKQIQIKTKNANLSNLQQKSLIIKKGQLLSGYLQKQFIGSSSNLNNIIHYVWMEISPYTAQKLINNIQKIVNNWLTIIGFSIGVSDLIPNKQILSKKIHQNKQLHKLYYNTLNQFRNKKEIIKNHLHQQGKKIMDSFQYNVNLQLNNRLSKIQEIIKDVPTYSKNNIYKIVQVKSKGSQTNLAQIFYSVGNQNINGQRCPLGFYRRSLPHFYKDDNSPFARGYVISSFYQGLKPTQLFFHSMGGREGLSDTAVKTSHVGYIQRKIVKSLEDLIVKYDSSVRDSKNNLLQNFYGEDGFCSQFIEKHRCIGAEVTRQRFRELYKWKQDQLKKIYRYTPSQIKIIKKQYTNLYRNRKIFKEIYCKNVESLSYDYFCPINIEKIIIKIKSNTQLLIKTNKQNQQKAMPLQICQKVQKLINECCLPPLKGLQYIKSMSFSQQKNKEKDQYQSFSDQFQREDESQYKNYSKKSKKLYNSQFQIFKMHLRFSLSSKILSKQREITKQSLDFLLSQIKTKYFKSLAPAGQAAGCLAAQSIGQPTTQMTLNTFHLAGISDKNVTLGLPRLQQLLNCSKESHNQVITIFPEKPILQSQSLKQQNQIYLLNMLLFQLPQRKIGDFVLSTHYLYNPKQNQLYPCQIIFVFGFSKIASKRIWNEILYNLEKSSGKLYQIEILIQFDDISSQNPKISIRYLTPQSITNISNISKKQPEQNIKNQKLITILQNLQNTIKQKSICGIKGISSVKLSKKSLCIDQKIGVKQYTVLQAFGKSFRQCLQHPMINKIKTYTNNIQQIYKVLGIEAARQSIINQLKQVLKPYGISINYRHLSVLADWMCSKGTIIPVNRNGLHKLKNVSTLTKASFQMASKILFKAASFSVKDDLKQTTAHIIFGQSTECGTSQCKLFIDTDKITKYYYKPQEDLKNQLTKSMEQILEKTPYNDQTSANDYSSFEGRNLFGSNNFYNRSPVSNLGISPNLLSFSPTYSPVPHLTSSISPKYTTYNQRPSISPTYQPQRNIPSSSPTYQTGNYRNRQPSTTSVLNNKLSSVGEVVNKKQQEQFSDEDTQRTQQQEKQYKEEDQF